MLLRACLLWGVATCCWLLPADAQQASTSPSAGSKPNIVLVITDDQGYPPIGRHGHPWIRTANLDQLFDQSTRFTRFFVNPTCSPTRAAIMSGRYPEHCGVTHTILERERMSLDTVTLPQVLKQAGYATGIFGKWHLGDEAPYQPEKRGFDEVFIHGAGGIGQAYNCSCADAPGNSYFDPYVRYNGKFVKTKGFCTDVFFTAALSWIKRVKDSRQPFFAYISTNAPHAPYHAPENYTHRFLERGFSPDAAGFYGMIENIDDNMGRLLDKLAAWQLLDKTVIIFMSDNGMAGGLGRPGEPIARSPDGTVYTMYNAGMRGLKGSPDEGGVRVPFWVRWDGHWPANRDVDRVAAHIDIFPTLAELAGAEAPPDQREGRSLLPLLDNPQAAWEDRFLFVHVGRWPKGADPDDCQWQNFSVRNQRFRLVNNRELYDMENDPGQTTNLIDRHPDMVAAMRQAYRRWWEQVRPRMVNEHAPLSETRPYHVWFEQQQRAEGIPLWQVPEL